MKPVLYFRWIAFLTAGITLVLVFIQSPYKPLGGPFRFFEVWVLMVSFFSMGRMMAIMERRSTREWPALVAASAALNATVIILYLAGLIGPGEARGALPGIGGMVLSIYLLSPALQIADAVFVHSSVGSIRRAALLVVVVIGVYLLWIERIVQTTSTQPWGDETDGLPYWSLNDLAEQDRAYLYAGVTVLALAALPAILGVRRLAKKSASGAPV